MADLPDWTQSVDSQISVSTLLFTLPPQVPPYTAAPLDVSSLSVVSVQCINGATATGGVALVTLQWQDANGSTVAVDRWTQLGGFDLPLNMVPGQPTFYVPPRAVQLVASCQAVGAITSAAFRIYGYTNDAMAERFQSGSGGPGGYLVNLAGQSVPATSSVVVPIGPVGRAINVHYAASNANAALQLDAYTWNGTAITTVALGRWNVDATLFRVLLPNFAIPRAAIKATLLNNGAAAQNVNLFVVDVS